MWQARQLGATHLVDVATLTGACVVALGRVMAGVFGGPTAFIEGVRAVGEQTGDRCWPMPSADDYFEQLKSDVADMTNTGGRPAGAVTAAVFLKQFVGRAALGAPGYRRCGLGRRRAALPGQRRHRCGHAVAGRTGARAANDGCRLNSVAPTSPILVRVVGPAAEEVTLGDVLINALGLTGAITVAAMVLGIVLGGLFILYRRRHPHNQFNGETSDEMSLKLG